MQLRLDKSLIYKINKLKKKKIFKYYRQIHYYKGKLVLKSWKE